MACKCNTRKVAKITLCVAVPVLAVSVVLLILFPTIYDDVLAKELTLEKGTILTGVWRDIPIPIYEKLYFFNITNKEAFLRRGEPLNVTEVGPYTYKSSWVKNDPQWNSNGTVSYREVRTYHFVPDLSSGTEDDLIYTLNGPMIIAGNIAKGYDVKLRAILSVLLGIEGEIIVIERSIRQLVYEGYEDIIIKLAPIVKPDIPFKNGIFSWLYGKNATDDGLYTVFTGADDAQKVGIMNNWDGEEKLSFWKEDTCNMLNGTNIEIGPSLPEDVESYTFFQSIFCRSITLKYTEDQTHLGILSRRFKPTYGMFANSTENPDNHCFEIEKERPSGLLDVSPCQFGSPLFVSFPHFYFADPSYLTPVNGLDPNERDHGWHLDVDPLTGCTVHAAVRFQINIEVSEVEGIFQTYNVTKGIFPIFWAELNLEIDEHMANFLKSNLRNPKIIAYSILGILAGISLILAIVFLVVLYRSESGDDPDDRLIDATDKECERIPNCTTGCTNHSYTSAYAADNEREACCKSLPPPLEKNSQATKGAPDEPLLPA